MKVDIHISELINEYDCVIVPGMGSFTVSGTPAGINSDKASVGALPKKIFFNNLLAHNDGLLAEHIALKEKINFMDALKEINLFVHQYQEEVLAGKKFIIERVGVLSADSDRNVQFEPFENTDKVKEPVEQAMEQPLELENIDDLPFAVYDSEQSSEVLNGEYETVSRESDKIVPALAVLLMCGSVWLLMYLYFFAPEKRIFTPDISQFRALDQLSLGSSPKSVEAVKTPDAETNTADATPAESVNTNTTEPAIASPLKSAAAEKKYYIVAGAFSILENAERLANDLKSQGFPDATIIDPAASLKMVSFGIYSSRDEATSELNRLKTEKREGWLYHH